MSAPPSRKIAWVSTWSRVCGIADYSKALWPAVAAELARGAGGTSGTGTPSGYEGELVSLDEFPAPGALIERLRALSPALIHFQHEYSIFGGKNPPLYRFPSLIRSLRRELPAARLSATLHNVIPLDYRFPVRGRGLEAPLRASANLLLLPVLSRFWHRGTWGGLDGSVVHSRLQKPTVEKSSGRHVEVIPHFVPALPSGAFVAGRTPVPRNPAGRPRTVVVFGFFVEEKGQDLAIEALAKLPTDVRLVLAGGVRRDRDQAYRDRCLARARELGLMNRIEVTGFVDELRLNGLFATADLVLAPFRETTGSGSLAQGLARGAAVLASDLPLNLEIAEREPGSLAFFRTGDPADCAARITALLGDAEALAGLRTAALRYASACAPAEIARRHVRYFESLMSREPGR